MVISNNLTGNELLTIQFLHTDALFYDYLATTSRFPSFRLKGILQQDEKAFTSEAELDAGGVTYPISFRYSLLDQLLDARSNDMFDVGSLTLSGGLSIGLNRAFYDATKYDPYEYLMTKYHEKWQLSNKLTFTATCRCALPGTYIPRRCHRILLVRFAETILFGVGKISQNNLP